MEIELSETATKILQFIVTMFPIGILDLIITAIVASIVKIGLLMYMFYTGVCDNGLPSWWTGVPRPRVSFRFRPRESAPERQIAVQQNAEAVREKTLALE
ncbi:hypothetical protein TNIN_30381 [Trichonephila inaurata madagascariensis]|uniref:Uncharacterized protein n=1 Tax=Trichonephila inaurata madagascariensis TaxID=2747483 RepID=A0A8X7CNM2_9ARAC|nr:hypothetical protein TNIN_30381 [Trichonephila inaurata madagascariensis]